MSRPTTSLSPRRGGRCSAHEDGEEPGRAPSATSSFWTCWGPWRGDRMRARDANGDAGREDPHLSCTRRATRTPQWRRVFHPEIACFVFSRLWSPLQWGGVGAAGRSAATATAAFVATQRNASAHDSFPSSGAMISHCGCRQPSDSRAGLCQSRMACKEESKDIGVIRSGGVTVGGGHLGGEERK